MKSLPPELQSITKNTQRCRSKEYRDYLFKSRLFKNRRQEVIEQAILKYNKGSFSKGITRQEAQYFDSFIQNPTLENTRIVKSDDVFAQIVKNDSKESIQEVKTRITNILKSKLKGEEKIAGIVSIIVQQQNSSTELMKRGFIGLAVQNTELKEKIDELQKKQEEELLILERRERRKNRKRLPQKDPMTEELYQFLIEEAEVRYGDTYRID